MGRLVFEGLFIRIVRKRFLRYFCPLRDEQEFKSFWIIDNKTDGNNSVRTEEDRVPVRDLY